LSLPITARLESAAFLTSEPLSGHASGQCWQSIGDDGAVLDDQTQVLAVLKDADIGERVAVYGDEVGVKVCFGVAYAVFSVHMNCPLFRAAIYEVG
jgi:hypothetical protein